MLRPANNADGEEIIALVFNVLEEYGLQPDPETTDADLRDIEESYQRSGGCFDVLLDNKGKIIGTVGLFAMEENRCELRKMYLHPDGRGKGKGKQLLEHALRRATELGFTSVMLETATELKEAISLYLSYGFVPYEAEHLSDRCDQAYIKQLKPGRDRQ